MSFKSYCLKTQIHTQKNPVPIINFLIMGKARECSVNVKNILLSKQTGIVFMNFDFLFQFFGTSTLLTLHFAIN